jgi:hypothetical protein
VVLPVEVLYFVRPTEAKTGLDGTGGETGVVPTACWVLGGCGVGFLYVLSFEVEGSYGLSEDVELLDDGGALHCLGVLSRDPKVRGGGVGPQSWRGVVSHQRSRCMRGKLDGKVE